MKSKRQSPTLLLVIAFVSFIIIGIPFGLLNIAWVYMQETFEVSLDSLGLLLAASMGGRLLISFISGRVVARIGLGRYLVLGGVCGVVGIVGYILSPSWNTLLIAAGLEAVGLGAIDTGMNIFVSSRYSARQMNWLHAFFGVGWSLGPAIVTFVVVTLGQSWRLSYGVMFIPLVILTVIFAFTVKKWTLNGEETEDRSDREGATIRESFSIPIVWLMVTVFLTYGGVEIGAGQLTNNLFVEGRGMPQANASFWITLYVASLTVGRMLIGTIGHFVSNRNIMRLSMFGAVIGATMLWLNLTNELGALGLAVIGFSIAPMFPMLMAETPRRVGIKHTPNAIGFQLAFGSIGGSLLPGLAGALAENMGLEVIGLFLTINAIVMLVVHEAILAKD